MKEALSNENFTVIVLIGPKATRQTIINTRNAWVPGMAKTWPFIAASAAK